MKIVEFMWGEGAERGTILGAIGAIILLTFIFPDPDVDLAVKYPGNPPYGILWFPLNALYWTKQLYPIIVFTEWAVVTAFQWWLVRKGKLPKTLVELQILSVAFLSAIHAQQDISVIIFAPFIVLIPMYVVLEFLQKIPFPGTVEWICAFNGSGTAGNAYANPCLSSGTKFFLFSSHIYSLSYILLAFWVIYPLVLWWKSRHA